MNSENRKDLLNVATAITVGQLSSGKIFIPGAIGNASDLARVSTNIALAIIKEVDKNVD